MVIKGDCYELESISDDALLFDLKLVYHIKGSNERDELRVAGYGMPLDTCIKKICNYLISQKHQNEVISLQQYFNDFKLVWNEINEKTKTTNNSVK